MTSNEIPTATLDELVALQTEKVAGTKEPSLPYIGLEHIAQRQPRLLGSAASSVSISTNSCFTKSDILFGKLRPNLRKSVRAEFVGYCSTDILVLRCRDAVRPEFAGHVFQWEPVFAFASATAAGTKMPRTSWTELKRFRVFCPGSENEQTRIAAVLDTVDAAIGRTEQVIAKLKQVRAGLLHDLLTRGLDEHGQLRDLLAHPEQFQDSSLGRIPKDWDVRPLGDCVHSQITYGIVQAGPHIEGGIPYIRTSDMSGDELRIEGMLRTSPVIAAAFRRSEVHTDEIVCAIRATLGKVLEVPLELDGANLTQGTARIAPKLDFNSRFVLWALRSDATQRQIALESKGTTFPEITLGNLRKIRIAISVDRDEQDEIVKAIESHEKLLRAEQFDLSKLHCLKSGLMTDLLTGRVLVPADLLGETA
jgi:type I restriction enzyme, S subunit